MSLKRKLKRKNETNVDRVVRQVNKDLYDKGINEGIKDGMTRATEFVITMVLYTLDYKLRDYMSEEEMKKIIKAIFLNIDSFRTEHLDSSDYQVIKKEMAPLIRLKGDML